MLYKFKLRIVFVIRKFLNENGYLLKYLVLIKDMDQFAENHISAKFFPD